MKNDNQVRKLFLVEDDPDILSMLGVTVHDLMPEFQIVGTASSAEETLRLLPKHQIDLLFLDVYLEGAVTGLDLIAQLRGNQPDMKILVSSGRYPDTDEKRAFVRKANGFLKKAFEPERFREAALTVVGGRLFYNDGVFEILNPQQRNVPAREVRLPGSLTNEDRDYLRRIMEGHTPERIAKDLHVKDETLAQRRYRIKVRLGLKTDIETFLFGLLNAPEPENKL